MTELSQSIYVHCVQMFTSCGLRVVVVKSVDGAVKIPLTQQHTHVHANGTRTSSSLSGAETLYSSHVLHQCIKSVHDTHTLCAGASCCSK